jgi:LysR family cys regulon transcriptional activator
MTFIQLRYLIAIIDSGFNISRAAEVLSTSQPGISRQIRILEQQLGTTVLARNGGRIVGLTESGVHAVTTARRIVKDMESLNLMSQEFLQQEGGTLTIGTLHTYALSMLPSALAAVLARYPKVLVNVRQTAYPLALELVQAGEIDVGVTIGSPPASTGLLGLPVADIPLALVVPVGHELLKQRRPLSLEDLLRYPMICLHSSIASWGVSSVYKANGIELHPSIYAMDASVMQSYVAHGIGIAVLPASLPTPANVRVISVSHLFPPSPVTAVIDPNRYMRGYVYEFIAHLAPRWTRREVDLAKRDVLFGTPSSTSSIVTRS